MTRSKEEFDQWFREHGGDPWGYSGAFVQDRLDRSLRFVQRHVADSFDGIFVEIGAFNGDFTARLAGAYPQSQILANDISEVALDQARAKTTAFPHVGYDLSDLSAFKLPDELRGRELVLTILETLYYLRHDEREVALKRLLGEAGRPLTFISGPVQGETYFREAVLRDWFSSFGYSLVDVDVLNVTDAFREQLHEASPENAAALQGRLSADAAYRADYARQVIYAFRPG